MTLQRRRAVAVIAAAVLVLSAFVSLHAPKASAAVLQPVPGHTRLVPETVRTNTPAVLNGEVSDIATIGNRVVLAGTFTSIRNTTGTAVAQKYMAAYDINTGQLDMAFRPVFDDRVVQVKASPDGKALYAVGLFSNVSGKVRKKIVKLSPTGVVDATFVANADSRVSALEVGTKAVYVGGQFNKIGTTPRGKFASLNPTTGAVDAGLNLPITIGQGPGGLLAVQSIMLTPDETKVVVVHTGRLVANQPRTGIFEVDATTKALLPWSTTLYDDNLPRTGGVLNLTNADISPDGSYFVAVAGSGGDRPPISDTAMAFPVAGGAGVQPLWISRHFDSIYAVAVTETAVYVGGHFHWEAAPGSPNPYPGDPDTAYGANNGAGATILGDQVVRREMLGALSPSTGKAMPWNPGATAQEGVKVLRAVPRGLLLGSDGTFVARRAVNRTAFFDFNATPPAAALDTFISDPFDGLTVSAAQPYTYRGSATAPAGVAKVQVEVLYGTQYLQADGTTIAPVYHAFLATLASPNATDTTWSLPMQPPPGSYQVTARTFDTTKVKDATKATVTYYVDDLSDLPPQTAITGPPDGSQSTNALSFTGTASDDRGVRGVRLTYRNLANNNYLQQDGSQASTFNTFGAQLDRPGDNAVNWAYDVTLPDGQWRVTASALDSGNQSDGSPSTHDYSVFPTNVAPKVTVVSPSNGAFVPNANQPVTISGTATDDTAIERIQIAVYNTQTNQGLGANGIFGFVNLVEVPFTGVGQKTVDWSYTTPTLPPGIYLVVARAFDNLNVTSPLSAALAAPQTFILAVPGDSAPSTTLTSNPGITQNLDSLTQTITGTATDAQGVSRVALVVRDANGRYVDSSGHTTVAYSELSPTLASPGGTSTTWSYPITLPGPQTYSVVARAVDTVNQYAYSTALASASWLIYPGDADPTIQVNSPTAGSSFSKVIGAAGRAFDDIGVARVDVQVKNASNQYMLANGTFSAIAGWVPAYVTNPNGAATNWNYNTPIVPPGTYSVTMRSVDVNGQLLQTPVTVTGVTVTN
jgi:hypothetical protein